MTTQEALAALVDGRSLDASTIEAVVSEVLSGEATQAQIGALLVALRMKGETIDELVGVARALRARAVAIPAAPAGAVDTCGTGGDAARTFNVSTAAAIVVAGAGVPVAKHGNRAVSGAVGSADVLETLDVRIDLAPAALATCLDRVGIVFLYAPDLHPAMRALAGPRRELAMRTTFNLIGPLVNPAAVRRQVIGVFDARWLEPLAQVLHQLGSERAWIVHGHGGLDELSLAGVSRIAELADGRVRCREIRAADLGFEPVDVTALQVGSAGESAERIESVLRGDAGPARDVVCLNAAAALVVAGRAPGLAAAAELAGEAIDAGRAHRVLEELRRFTHEHAGGGKA